MSFATSTAFVATPRRERTIRAGWARTRVPIGPGMVVLDVGSGSFPNRRADLLCERDLVDNRHRGGLPITVDRPLLRGDALALPLRDGAVDFVIASHIAEHVDDPAAFCAELARVASAGYIETPSPLFEWLFDVEYHEWVVSGGGSSLRFRRKQPRPRWQLVLTEPLYRIYFANQPSPGRPTLRLPDNALGRLVGRLIRVVSAAANRSGVLHTRVTFTPAAPLRCTVD